MTREQYAVLLWKRITFYKKKSRTPWNTVGLYMNLNDLNLYRYRKNHVIPSVYNLINIADLFGISLDQLCDVSLPLE